jgi:hypothetical protein
VFLKIVCAWCGRFMGIKRAEDATLPISHSICCECKRKLEQETETLLQETKTIHP